MDQERCEYPENNSVVSRRKTLIHVLNCDTTYVELCLIYERDRNQQRCMLQRELFSCSMNKGDDVASYISKLENIACRLKALEEEITNSQMISKVLARLPESFRSFATAWESTEGKKTLEFDRETVNRRSEKYRSKRK